MTQTGIFKGRVLVPYAYGCYGYTRGGGKTWHGGIDLVGPDDATIHMPYFYYANGTEKEISGTVVTARKVDRDTGSLTWEWGWYVCVKLDNAQTPDAVNYLYFCHCACLLVSVGQKVKSGDALAIMGNSGNAALNNPPYKHCHLEARATATGTGVDPTAYSGTENAVGTYGALPVTEPDKPSQDLTAVPNSQFSTLQLVSLAPLTDDQVRQTDALAESLGLADSDHYKVQRVDDGYFAVTATVSNGDAMQFMALAQRNGWDKLERYHSRFVG